MNEPYFPPHKTLQETKRNLQIVRYICISDSLQCTVLRRRVNFGILFRTKMRLCGGKCGI